AYAPEAMAKVLRKNEQQGAITLRELRQVLEQASNWTAEALEKAIEAFCQEKNLGLGKVAQPLRVAISGTTVSPPIFQSLEFLGQERTLARIDRCLAAV